jgi:hypothetical protein
MRERPGRRATPGHPEAGPAWGADVTLSESRRSKEFATSLRTPCDSCKSFLVKPIVMCGKNAPGPTPPVPRRSRRNACERPGGTPEVRETEGERKMSGAAVREPLAGDGRDDSRSRGFSCPRHEDMPEPTGEVRHSLACECANRCTLM